MRGLSGRTLTTVLSIMFATMPAVAVELVADLNQGASARPVYWANARLDTSQGSFLSMQESSHGVELWFSDNTPQGTRLVKDIYPGSASSGPTTYTKLGDNTVFLATDGAHGFELWRTDGTAAGTFMLADIGPGPQPFGGDYPSAVLDGVLYFAANDGVTGNELWRTDGTREGTHLVSDIVPGFDGSYPTAISAGTTHLYFARQGQIWVSDGTADGTRLAVEVGVFRCCQVVGDAVFFTAADTTHGMEMWRMDGDGSNPTMVANLNTEPLGNGQDRDSDPYFMFNRGDSTIFIAYVPNPDSTANERDCRMYRADVSGGGVTELANFGVHCPLPSGINLPAGSLFSVSNTSPGVLWVTDGTPSGTMPMDRGMYFSADDGASPLKVAYGPDGEAYFFAREPVVGAIMPPDKIWVTDGTRAGTRVFADLTTYSEHREIAWLDGRLYFDAGGLGSHAAQDELWTSDGTPGGTFLVRDVNIVVGSTITDLRAVNGRLQFFATGSGTGRGLWSSDGTHDGTISLIATNEGSVGNADSNPVFAGQLGARAVLTADRGSGNEGHELHTTDGTSAGTSVVRGLFAGGPSNPDNFLVNGDQILFVADDVQSRRGLWRTDGSSAGTIPLEVLPGEETSNVLLGDSGSIVGGVVYFTAATSTLYFQYRELWRTDGTPIGTFKVPGDVGQRVNILGGNGTHLLYQALSEGRMHLWSWNGSQAQIISAADNLNVSSSPGVTFDGRVCFRASDVSLQSLDVWCASGLAGDVLRATNFSTTESSAGDLFPLGDKLLVNVPGTGATSGLFVTNGSAASTQRISEEHIANAKLFGNQQLVFVSESGGLMLTDGTVGGTRSLLQGVTLPGSLGGTFGILGNFVVFVVNDAVRGATVWRTDGTPSGARYLVDLDVGTAPAQAGTGQFFTLGERLLFSGYRTSIGNELWSINAADPNASDDAASAVGGTAIALDVLDNDADFDGTLNAGSVSIVTQPEYGTASVNPNTGTITYTAAATFSGTDTLSYRVSDDQGRQSNVAAVSFKVTAGSSGVPPTQPPANPPSSSGGGGGGALGGELWWLLLLGGFRMVRQRLLRHD